MANTTNRWNYIHIDTRDIMRLSGWKLYIYGRNTHQANILSIKLLDIVKKYNLTTKIATKYIINRNKDKQIPWSSMIIYLTELIFVNNQLDNLLNDINTNLTNYKYKGKIIGAKSINGKIHYRYDLIKPINPINGIDYDEYQLLYRGETGNYNINNNLTIL